MARRAVYEVPYIFGKVARETGYDIKDISAGYDAFIRALKKCINTSDSVYLRDFGTFRQKFLGRRVSKSYVSGENYVVDAHLKTSFISDSDAKRRAYRRKIRDELKRQEALQYALNAERYVREQERAKRKAEREARENASRSAEQTGSPES